MEIFYLIRLINGKGQFYQLNVSTDPNHEVGQAVALWRNVKIA